jgi:hypothetical protein
MKLPLGVVGSQGFLSLVAVFTAPTMAQSNFCSQCQLTNCAPQHRGGPFEGGSGQ